MYGTSPFIQQYIWHDILFLYLCSQLYIAMTRYQISHDLSQLPECNRGIKRLTNILNTSWGLWKPLIILPYFLLANIYTSLISTFFPWPYIQLAFLPRVENTEIYATSTLGSELPFFFFLYPFIFLMTWRTYLMGC